MYFRHLVFLLACSAASVHALPGPVPDDETSACDKENGAQCILEPDCEDLGRFCCTGPLSPNDGNPTECTSYNSNAFKCTEDGFENVYCCSFALSEGGMGVGCVKWKL